MITTEEIKKLRDQTGISIMQCKKALEEAEGDSKKALVILQKQSSASASKKADRSLGAGIIQAYIHGEGSVGSMVELSCETDFVAKNEEFKQLAYDIAMHIAASNPEFLREDDISEEDKASAKEVFAKEAEGKPEEVKEKIISGKLDAYFKEKTLINQTFIKNPEKTINNLIEEAVQKFGEKTEVTRFSRFSIGS